MVSSSGLDRRICSPAALGCRPSCARGGSSHAGRQHAQAAASSATRAAGTPSAAPPQGAAAPAGRPRPAAPAPAATPSEAAGACQQQEQQEQQQQEQQEQQPGSPPASGCAQPADSSAALQLSRRIKATTRWPALQQLLERQAPQLNAIHLSMAATHLASIARPRRLPTRERLRLQDWVDRGLVARAVAALPGAGPKELASLLLGLARLQHPVEDEALEALLARAAQLLHRWAAAGGQAPQAAPHGICPRTQAR
jgi:hypothetical protein